MKLPNVTCRAQEPCNDSFVVLEFEITTWPTPPHIVPVLIILAHGCAYCTTLSVAWLVPCSPNKGYQATTSLHLPIFVCEVLNIQNVTFVWVWAGEYAAFPKADCSAYLYPASNCTCVYNTNLLCKTVFSVSLFLTYMVPHSEIKRDKCLRCLEACCSSVSWDLIYSRSVCKFKQMANSITCCDSLNVSLHYYNMILLY